MTDLTTSGSGVGDGGGAATLQDHAHEVAGSAREQGAEVARSAVDHARTVVDAAGEQVQRQGDEQAKRLAESLVSVSSDLRSMAGQTGQGSVVGGVARSLAESAERTATVLRDEGPNGVVRRASDFGREHPVQFLALAAGAGFALARVVRNSDARRLQDAAKQGASGELTSGADRGNGSSRRESGAEPLGATGAGSGRVDPSRAGGGGSSGMPASAVGL
jgi:hypothetical protein